MLEHGFSNSELKKISKTKAVVQCGVAEVPLYQVGMVNKQNKRTVFCHHFVRLSEHQKRKDVTWEQQAGLYLG